MNFYEMNVTFNDGTLPFESGTPLFPSSNEGNSTRWLKEAYSDLNKNLGVKCDDKDAFSFFVWEGKAGEMSMIFSIDEMDKKNQGEKDALAFLKKYLEDNYAILDIVFSGIREITTTRFWQLGVRAEHNGFVRHFRGEAADLRIDFSNNCQYRVKEEMAPDRRLSLTEAKKRAEELMADDSFMEELERIYSDLNEKTYYGNPVHYCIETANTDAGMDMAKLLVHALKVNHRLIGGRISKIDEIKEGCYNEEDFENLIGISHGNAVVVNLTGSSDGQSIFASSYEEVIEYLSKITREYQLKTLFIFIKNIEHPRLADKMLASLAEDIDIISIKEGKGSPAKALRYIQSLLMANGEKATKTELKKMLPDKQIFTLSEVMEIYHLWLRDRLKNQSYRAYQSCNYMVGKKEDKRSEPYDELQKMIGLTEVKELVDEVIDSGRLQKIRNDMGMDSFKTSLHMVFTGNPGSAKTTVARLIAQIFLKEGLLSTGKYVECGRADLVGQYVGWTAKTVRKKFREAKGGVLFIDEAYSLVDSSNSFGDEAINTIVQEMENYRDDIIVIFAGYPEKMKEFLDKNEGLRSRIAFHLDFPDYNAEELLNILKLMASQKGYKLDKDIEKKAYHIFAEAANQPEFGNGRFVRNLLEQAMMAQARRIMENHKGKEISRSELSTLTVDDFDVNAKKKIAKQMKNVIGFAG